MIESRSAGFALAATLSLLLSACKTTPTEVTPAPSASAAASASAGVRPPSFPVPTGPRLAILAGQGVGAIRIGAQVSTVERLMEAPCDEKSPTLCRYYGRAVEFELGDDGKVRRIRAHRRDRAAGASGRVYGVFNGAIPPDVELGMLIPAVQQYLGPPDRVEASNTGAAPEAVAQHFYKGLVVEYDRLPNDKVVMGGVRIPD